MANLGDISKIQLPNGDVVSVKDAFITDIVSQTYNSADCNISLILRQDSTEDLYVHYDTDARKLYMPYKVIKNQYKYWKDGVEYLKYHVLTEGVIMTNNSAKCNMLTSDTPEIANETYNRSWVATDDGGSAVTTAFNLSKANSAIGDVWYNRAYIIYADLETSMVYKMYGPVYKITAGVPCKVECVTLSCTQLTAKEQANENNIVLLQLLMSIDIGVDPPVARTNGGYNYVGVSSEFGDSINAILKKDVDYTVQSYGIIYCNDGTVSQLGLLKVENIDNVHILVKENKTGSNLRDLGNGVIAVLYIVVVIGSKTYTIYSPEDIGGNFNEITSTSDLKTKTNAQLTSYVKTI